MGRKSIFTACNIDHKRSKKITDVDKDSMSVIFSFLNCKDALSLCKINKISYKGTKRV